MCHSAGLVLIAQINVSVKYLYKPAKAVVCGESNWLVLSMGGDGEGMIVGVANIVMLLHCQLFLSCSIGWVYMHSLTSVFLASQSCLWFY